MLEVCLLGKFAVSLDGQPINIPWRPAQSLLAYLLLNVGCLHRREKLAGLLWPDSDEANARNNLRQTLWRLRQAVGEDYILADKISVGFNSEANYQLDVDHLLDEDAETSSVEALIQIVSAYQGSLLPGFYEDWVVLEQERLQALFEGRMQLLLERLTAAFRWREVRDWAERWIAQGQGPEPAYRALMMAHAGLGDQAGITTAFQRCLKALNEQIGVEPSPETRELFERLTAAEPLPGTPKPRPLMNLPRQLTSFIGRENEVAQLTTLLANPTRRLVTLVGAGGIGKTRLAFQVAAELGAAYPDGVWLVELAPLSDPALVLQKLAVALGVREELGRALLATLTNYLRGKSLLLVLDNCEHLIEVCAQVADTLLHACPKVCILATSRERLGLAGERVWCVAPLSLPDAQHLPPLKYLTRYEAIQLFVARATTVLPAFRLTRQNAPALAQVCQRLDGLPLAIELAAPRVEMLRVEQIAARLAAPDRFGLLTGGSRTALPRHQTLQASIAWSYDLLSEVERAVLRRLAVFVGRWTLEAAEAICAGDDVEKGQALDLLTQLVKKSLIVVQREPGRETRYHLLETIREYALVQLVACGEAEAARRRHADFFLALVEEAEPHLTSAEAVVWLKGLEPEQDNFLAAFEWALDHAAEIGLRFVGALLWFWRHLGIFGEGRKWFDKVAPLIEALGPSKGRAQALYSAASLARAQGDYVAACALNEESVVIWRSLGAGRGLAHALAHLGKVARAQGDHTAARHYLEESVAIFQKIGDSWGLALALTWLGSVASAQGDDEVACSLYSESVTIFREIGDKWYLPVSLGYWGYAACRQGDFAAARSFFAECFTLWREMPLSWAIAWGLEGLAGVIGAQEQAEPAARLFGAAEALLEAFGVRLDASDRADYERNVATVRAQLGEAAFAAVWAEGRVLSLEQAIGYALEII